MSLHLQLVVFGPTLYPLRVHDSSKISPRLRSGMGTETQEKWDSGPVEGRIGGYNWIGGHIGYVSTVDGSEIR